MVRLLAIVAILLSVSACGTGRFNHVGMPKPPTEGPPDYIAGWEDGCETGMTTYSHSFMQTRYKANINAQMMATNQNYNKGWRLGNKYCTYYTSRYMTLGYIDAPGFNDSDLRSEDTWFFNGADDGFSLFKGWEVPSAFQSK